MTPEDQEASNDRDNLAHDTQPLPGPEAAEVISATTATAQCRNICPFYRKGTCSYEHNGRMCPRENLPVCKKLMKDGKRGPIGWTAGKDCEVLSGSGSCQ